MAGTGPLHLLQSLIRLIWGDWQTNQPWQRIVKYSIACVIAFIVSILPALSTKSTFLIPMVTVFAHPGQRMGLMIEALLMILIGSLLGLLWSLLGLYLSNLVYDSSQSASYTIRGIFLVIASLFHGVLRSSSPRLFNFVLFSLVAVLTTLEVPVDTTTGLFTDIYVPVLIGGAILVVVNLTIFPEVSSSHLGTSTITAVSEAVQTLDRAIYWFVTPGGDAPHTEDLRLQPTVTDSAVSDRQDTTWLSTLFRLRSKRWRRLFERFPSPFSDAKQDIFFTQSVASTSLSQLTDHKAKLRSRLRACRAAQNEVNFEISLSSLPPSLVKSITCDYMTDLVQEVVTIIGACENKYILLVAEDSHIIVPPAMQAEGQSCNSSSEPLTPTKRPRARRKHSKLDDVKPVREIEACNVELLEAALCRIREPVSECQSAIKDAVDILVLTLAFCMDVSRLPSGERASASLLIEDIDAKIDKFADSIHAFDVQSAAALKRAAMDRPGQSLDFTPRMETFLISSFVLAFRQSASQLMLMLRHMRDLVELKQTRKNRLFVWLPKIGSIRQWLSTGGEAEVSTASESPKAAVAEYSAPVASGLTTPGDPATGTATPSRTDEEAPVRTAQREAFVRGPTPKQAPKRTLIRMCRQRAADTLEWAQKSSDLVYATKLAVAIMLVSWPALVPSWNQWYAEVRGIWAPLQLVLVFELAIGSSFMVVLIRLFGVVLGGIVGYLSYEIARGNRAGVVVVLLFGIVPSIYVQVVTKYVKAGMISIVSMTVVALATVDTNSPGYEVFYKRLVAFLIGSLAAILIEVILYPVRARDMLVESLKDSVLHIETMQAAVAVGIDHPEKPNFRSKELYARFHRARNQAQSSLNDAEQYLPFCLAEPRLKGSFKPLAPIYTEIIYVLHQIIDRMINVVQLRRAYGSSVLEDLNSKVHAHRRNVAASCTLILFTVNEALTTWLPLPQFLPSARLAQLRLINRIREILGSERSRGPTVLQRRYHNAGKELDEGTAKVITQRKFLSWNAATAGQMEIIEYLEELTDLVKLLVGVNAFQSGVLETPTYREYAERVEADVAIESSTDDDEELSKEMDTADAAENGQSHAAQSQRPRAATVGDRSKNALHILHRETKKEAEHPEGEATEDIPLSLQRVGTRLRRDNAVARKRALTMSEGRR